MKDLYSLDCLQCSHGNSFESPLSFAKKRKITGVIDGFIVIID